VSVHGFRRGTPVRRKSSALRVATQRSCRAGRRRRRTGPLSAADGCRKADGLARSAAAAPRADLWGLSVLGRFNSLIVDLVLADRLIYFPVRRLGNLAADVSQYQSLAGKNSTAGQPGIGRYALSSRRPGNPIHGALLSHQALQPVEKVRRLARAGLVRADLAQQHHGCRLAWRRCGRRLAHASRSRVRVIGAAVGRSL
jgi:hypothetical protein